MQYGDGTFAPKGRVFQLDMLFNPPVTAGEAKLWIRREAPPDGSIAFDVRKPTCEQIRYTSRFLAAAFKEKVGVMMAELSTGDGSGPYSASSVDDVLFLPTGDRSTGC